jgi:hypothetical protein
MMTSMRSVVVALVLVAGSGCGGRTPAGDSGPPRDVAATDAPAVDVGGGPDLMTSDVGGGGDAAGVDCGGCTAGKLCCPSRFSGDIPRCIDPMLNPENCGRCGHGCDTVCENGQCGMRVMCSTDGGTGADAGTCPGDLYCSDQMGAGPVCCPPGTTFRASIADFFGCCPDGDICGCRQGACPISRREAKADIRYLQPDDLARLGQELLSTRLATYRYRPGVVSGPDATTRRHLGFIIDDGAPAHGIAADGAPAHGIAADGRHVDLYGYVSLAVATLQVQSKQLAELRAELDSLRRELRQTRHK